jgi:hypothetical protein
VKDWQSQQDRFRAALYSLRGQIEKSQKAYEAAAKDFQQSYAIRSSALAAEQLGEIAEMKNDYTKAVDEYLLAFVLPEEGPAGKVDRREVRKKLGNVWRQVHGSEQGLGEQILVTYDHLGATSANLNPPARNKGAKDSFSFVLRNLDGSPLPLAPLKGKVVVLSFWGHMVRPLPRNWSRSFVQNREKNYTGKTQIWPFYARQHRRRRKPSFPGFCIQGKKWDVPVVFADGLDDFMNVTRSAHGDHPRPRWENRIPHGRISNQRLHRRLDHRYPGSAQSGKLEKNLTNLQVAARLKSCCAASRAAKIVFT